VSGEIVVKMGAEVDDTGAQVFTGVTEFTIDSLVGRPIQQCPVTHL